MHVLDLFSGIGGFSLGLERAGMCTVAFCECDPYCRAVLRRHWPDVPVYDDVRTLTAEALANAERPRLRSAGYGITQEWSSSAIGQSSIDLICGGFPCQDISVAGKGAGITGERSGLWSEFARIIGDVGPRYVIIENVAALLGRGLVRVLCDHTALGYDAEWHCIPASAVGAPHRRDRIWIVAYAQARAERPGLCARKPAAQRGRRSGDSGWAHDVGEPGGSRLALGPGTLAEWAHAATTGTGWWATESGILRVASRVPNRMDRLRALGNSLVPQIAEIIGRAIIEQEQQTQGG